MDPIFFKKKNIICLTLITHTYTLPSFFLSFTTASTPSSFFFIIASLIRIPSILQTSKPHPHSSNRSPTSPTSSLLFDFVSSPRCRGLLSSHRRRRRRLCLHLLNLLPSLSAVAYIPDSLCSLIWFVLTFKTFCLYKFIWVQQFLKHITAASNFFSKKTTTWPAPIRIDPTR